VDISYRAFLGSMVLFWVGRLEKESECNQDSKEHERMKIFEGFGGHYSPLLSSSFA